MNNIKTRDPAERPVLELAGVGQQMAAKLARLNVYTLQDVLFHLPSRYEDKTSVSKIGELSPGQATVIIGEIELAQVVFGRRRSLLVRVSDGTGSLTIRLFYFNRAQERSFNRGLWVRCFGEPRRGAKGLEMIHPQYRIFEQQPSGGFDKTLTPVYPTTEGVSQLLWRKITDQVLEKILPAVTELLDARCLPAELKESLQAASLQQALLQLHRPAAGVDLEVMHGASSAAHRRLIFEELLAHHFSLRKSKAARAGERALALQRNHNRERELKQSFGFKLTTAQQRVMREVAEDLAKSSPMLRLVQGDVGCGKTVVAALAMLQAVESKTQTVLMAPTELLAEQHYQTLRDWFEPMGIEVGWLASKTPATLKSDTLRKLADGDLMIAVGTHALIQPTVQYHQLGLVVIDEQHRFGVDQRLALRNKTGAEIVPHQMVMSATPIPRTLAMSFYADLDVSNIDELPPGRTPVETVVMPADSKREEVIERVRLACRQGRQVYWVCPLIDESEVLSAQAATDTEQLLTAALPELTVGLVHGRMKPKDKEATMQAFRDAEIDLLVATTVIEVGVDVPNASLMIIENAERMGLAQLHQLRGRVGRGSEKSFCILLYQAPLGQHAKYRLQTLRETNDGFAIAEKDLAMRGAGELLGTRQTGSLGFKVADIIRDQHLLTSLDASARQIETLTPEIIDPLIGRWIGNKEAYVNA